MKGFRQSHISELLVFWLRSKGVSDTLAHSDIS